MAKNIGLFFNTAKHKKPFSEILQEVQEYISSKYATVMQSGGAKTADHRLHLQVPDRLQPGCGGLDAG